MQSLTMINRIHSIDNSYFNNIDTPEKAYWLGFIWADGNISKTTNRSSGPNRLRVSQKWTEKPHLENFQKAIKSNYDIKAVYHPNNKIVAQLDINCRPLCCALSNLGYDIKTKRTEIPQLKEQLLSHFVRGYFDGDGCLSLYTQKIGQWTVNKQEFSITGNKLFIENVKTLLTEKTQVTHDVKLKFYKKSTSSATVRYGKISDIKKLYDYLYNDATIYLESKHKKFVEFFSRYAS